MLRYQCFSVPPDVDSSSPRLCPTLLPGFFHREKGSTPKQVIWVESRVKAQRCVNSNKNFLVLCQQEKVQRILRLCPLGGKKEANRARWKLRHEAKSAKKGKLANYKSCPKYGEKDKYIKAFIGSTFKWEPCLFPLSGRNCESISYLAPPTYSMKVLASVACGFLPEDLFPPRVHSFKTAHVPKKQVVLCFRWILAFFGDSLFPKECNCYKSENQQPCANSA